MEWSKALVAKMSSVALRRREGKPGSSPEAGGISVTDGIRSLCYIAPQQAGRLGGDVILIRVRVKPYVLEKCRLEESR